jgi:flagellar hook-associated protein 3 FlgL
MRIADKMAFNQVNSTVAKNRSDMADLQSQAATQKRINKPSDDPLASARVLGARTEERGSTQYIKNMNYARSFLEFSDQSLAELTDVLVRAKELAISQASDASGNADSRMVTAAEIDQIHSQALQIANRKLGERFIFGGYRTQSLPFNSSGEYLGDDGSMKIQIHKDSFVAMNVPGSKIFFGRDNGGTPIVNHQAPLNVQDLKKSREEELEQKEKKKDFDENFLTTRGPASAEGDPITGENGINLFKTLKELEISLKTNDKEGIQGVIDLLDQGIQQVVLARSEVGSRVASISSTTESLQKAIVDNKTMASQLEDADTFQVISDINKTDSALRATLETSGKLIQPSLLDFLK